METGENIVSVEAKNSVRLFAGCPVAGERRAFVSEHFTVNQVVDRLARERVFGEIFTKEFVSIYHDAAGRRE